MTNISILVVGEIIWDVYENDKKYLGGAPLNFALNAQNVGGEIDFISAVGDDELGQEAKSILSKKINTQFIQVNNHLTGRCDVTLKNTIPHYQIRDNCAFDYLVRPVVTKHYDALYFNTLIQRNNINNEVIEALLSNSYREIFCDLNLRPNCYTKESVAKCLKHSSILKLSKEDEKELKTLDVIFNYQSIKDIMKNFSNIKIILLTNGDKGVDYIFSKDYCIHHLPARHVEKVVSTVGAGDSFSAAFLVSYLKDLPIEKCLESAIELSAKIVSKIESY